jgi:hypothetical protein
MTCTAEKEESIRLRRKERACQARQTAAVSIKIEITRSENNCSYQQRRKTSRHKNKQEIYYEKFSLLLLCFEDNFLVVALFGFAVVAAAASAQINLVFARQLRPVIRIQNRGLSPIVGSNLPFSLSLFVLMVDKENPKNIKNA